MKMQMVSRSNYKNKYLSLLLSELLILMVSYIQVINGIMVSFPESDFQPINNQKEAFPNTFESPTTKKQLETKEFKIPLLSRALYELDPTKKITKETFMRTIKYSAYNLSKGELEQIFIFADTDHNESIDYLEWEKFLTLFVYPFEACNKIENSNDFPSYLLDEKQFERCFESDPKSKFIKFRRRDMQTNHYKIMMETISTRGESKINFHDYLFIRKTMFAWMKCHSHNTFMAESHFRCGIKLIVPNKLLLKISLRSIYKTGLKYQYKDSSLIQLDFISFLRISYYTNVFFILGLPHDSTYIERTQFLKAIREDRLPSNFEESEVEAFYSITFTKNLKNIKSEINFETFCFFMHMHKLFNKYSLKRPMLLEKDELLKLLDDKLTPVKTVLGIDHSFNNFTESQYQEASLILQRQRTNENKFFYSFRQDASERTRHATLSQTVNNTYYDLKNSNKTNREIFFGIFGDKDEKTWTHKSFFRAFQLANLYSEIAEISFVKYHNDRRPFVKKIPVEMIIKNINKAYETTVPAISQYQRRNYPLYKLFPKEISIDLLTFLTIENFAYKIYQLTGKYSRVVQEITVKVLLEDCGMRNMPDSVIDLAKKGFDKLRRRIYDSRKLAKYILITHVVASENARGNKIIHSHSLKRNDEVSRAFPMRHRRFKSSPLA
jgi:hypothetical protein